MLQNPHDRRRGERARTTPGPMRMGCLDADKLSAYTAGFVGMEESDTRDGLTSVPVEGLGA